MNAPQFAAAIGRPVGTVRRWLRQKNGLPHRKYGLVVIIELEEGKRWVKLHDLTVGGRSRNRVTRTRTQT